MAQVYLNNNDKIILARIKEKSIIQEEIDILNKILSTNETKRQQTNKKARIYKNEKRKLNKHYARSKKEISRFKSN